MDYMTPAYVGASAIGGLYIARMIRGSVYPVGVTEMAMAAGIAAASAAVAPGISARLVCPHSPGAPLVEAAASAAVSWAGLASLSNMNDANMFVPVQVGAYLVGTYASKYARAYWVQQKGMAAEGETVMGTTDGPP